MPEWRRPLTYCVLRTSELLGLLIGFLPELYTVRTLSAFSGETWRFARGMVEAQMLLFAFCGLGLISLNPSFVYLDGHFSGGTLRNPLTSTFAATFVVAYPMIGSAIVFAPVTSVVLRMAGVRDARRGIYQLLKSEFGYMMRSAHLPIYAVAGTAHANESPVQFVDAYLHYNFGGIELLCKGPYEPSAGPSVQSSSSAKTPFTSAADVPKVETKEKKASLANHDKSVHHVTAVPVTSGAIAEGAKKGDPTGCRCSGSSGSW